jgi:hypothetical protein
VGEGKVKRKASQIVTSLLLIVAFESAFDVQSAEAGREARALFTETIGT